MTQTPAAATDSLTGKVQAVLPESAHDTVQSVADTTQRVSSQIGAQAKQQLDVRSTQAGEQLHTVSKALRNATTDLRTQGNETPAKLLEPVAERAADVATYLQQSGPDQMLHDIETFGRKQPWVVIAGGLTLGFLASRFLKASSVQRRQSVAGGEPHYSRFAGGPGPAGPAYEDLETYSENL